ncbi:MAG: hypothetical protein IGS38_05465 [Synechococcales cyanobacterium M58_A2018_015]|nr:hypothetical protein [Synechococcales cyanobacterium M58_A2018_015]
MLYLAEVLRKTRVIGSGRAELKLLACQRSEQSWSAVPGEEVIPAPDDANYNAGTLVMVELSAGKQIQRHNEASRQLVSILQNFSRLQEKAKTQEEEIEQWKQSLTYQSQELNRRELEIEARQEQLQQLEAESEKLEQQRQAIDAAQAEVDRLREEFERKTQELEGAWAQLRGEANRLEDQQAQLQQSGLDEEQVRQVEAWLDRLAMAAPDETLPAALTAVLEAVQQQQTGLNRYWQTLEQQRSAAQQLQTEVDQQTQMMQQHWADWRAAQQALEQAQADLQVQQRSLSLKQEYAKALASQLQLQETLYQQVAQLAGAPTKVDVDALERLSLEELQATVADLGNDLEKLSRFVSSQEEELTLQQQAIDDLRSQIQTASEYDRLRLETELADEQDRYQMLNETLVGQRRNLQERQDVLKQHQLVLAKRQGLPPPDDQPQFIDIEPVLTQIEQARQRQAQELQMLEQDIQQSQEALATTQASVNQQANEQNTRWAELQQLDQALRAQIAVAAEHWGKVNTYQDLLQPLQDALTTAQQQADVLAAQLNQLQDAAGSHRQAIEELRAAVHGWAGNPVIEGAAL